MTVGIMQPYFFPYLGYWQLLNAVDTYVILDDVTYIKRGWINHKTLSIHSKFEIKRLKHCNLSSIPKEGVQN